MLGQSDDLLLPAAANQRVLSGAESTRNSPTDHQNIHERTVQKPFSYFRTNLARRPQLAQHDAESE